MNPELLKLLRDVPGLPQETTDSIMTVLGLPGIPVQEGDVGPGVAGTTSVPDRVITMNPHVPMSEELRGEVFAHELAHLKATDPEPSERIVNLKELFLNRMDALPPQERVRVMEEHGGFGEGFFQQSARRVLPEEAPDSVVQARSQEIVSTLMGGGFQDIGTNEIFAEAIENGFRLARSPNPQVAQADSVLPFSREAFDFFIRNLQGGVSLGNE